MTAIEITEFGDADVLLPVKRDVPQPGVDEVLIKIVAAGVNRPDIMQRRGMYPAPPDASDIPGLEIAGYITAIGANVTHFHAGDAVCALVSGGGYAEYCTASAALCLPIPPGVSMIEAAAVPETFYTVWSNLLDRGQLQAGETLLVHGGSSGIGTTAIQLAKLHNAKVITTCGNDEKCQFCLQLGADAVINYNSQDFVSEVAEFTAKKGVNIILDIIGGDYLPRNLQCLAEDGRLLQIALQHGPKTDINLLPIMLKRLTLTGSTLRARPVAFKASIAKNLQQQVWPKLESGEIKPIIFQSFPLIAAAEAHKLMESSLHMGKIVLTV